MDDLLLIQLPQFSFKISFCIFFGCAECCWLWLFLQLRQVGATLRWGAWASQCSGFSCCRAPALWHEGFSGQWALQHRFSSYGARALLPQVMGDFPRPGIQPLFPALTGGLLTTGQPGRSLNFLPVETWLEFKPQDTTINSIIIIIILSNQCFNLSIFFPLFLLYSQIFHVENFKEHRTV